MLKKMIALLMWSILFLPSLIFALTFSLPSGNNAIVGYLQTATVKQNQDITDIGQEYGIGYFEFLEANLGTNIDNLYVGEKIIIPTRFILPSVPRRGIVINLSELRLYFYPPGRQVVMTFPIGIGRENSATPLMQTRVIGKRRNPTWTPTEETRAEAEEKGITLPAFVEAGSDNPLGDYALRLAPSSYLIHGTNDPTGVGIRSSGGCIRMFPEGVEQLFPLVKIGTPVNIIDQPYKIGWNGNTLYLEVHVPLDHKHGDIPVPFDTLIGLIKPEISKYRAKIDWGRVWQVAKNQSGIPEPVGIR